MCSYRVASVTKYKGDKAKREFTIDNTVELNLIREKYSQELKTDDGKKILPAFFEHVSKQKGYYDPHHKAYIQHDTTMDYLQTIVKKFRTRHSLQKPTSKLVDIFNTVNYDERWVNHKQVSHIMKAVMEYKTETDKLYYQDYFCNNPASMMGYEDYNSYRFEMSEIQKEKLLNTVSNYKIGFNTMIFIIKELERKQYIKYRNILLRLLFTSCNSSFLEAINRSKTEIERIIEVPKSEKYDLKLYDICVKIC